MSTTLEAPPENKLRLPDIELSELPESTKDFIIAASAATGMPVKDVIREVLNKDAIDHGFDPKKVA